MTTTLDLSFNLDSSVVQLLESLVCTSSFQYEAFRASVCACGSKGLISKTWLRNAPVYEYSIFSPWGKR